MKVLFIVGLPGSGKTYYINKNKHFFDKVLDDFVTPYKLKEALEKRPHRLFVADPEFCREYSLKKAIKVVLEFTMDIDVIYFENAPEKALANASTRSNKEVSGYIYMLSKIYFPPQDSLKIYQP